MSLEHVFDTDRLTVYRATVETELHPITRIQYLAYHKLEDRPLLVANLLMTPMAGRFVDWLEVSSEYRRQGFGRELIEAVEKDVGELDVSPGSELGEAFLDAIGM